MGELIRNIDIEASNEGSAFKQRFGTEKAPTRTFSYLKALEALDSVIILS